MYGEYQYVKPKERWSVVYYVNASKKVLTSLFIHNINQFTLIYSIQ